MKNPYVPPTVQESSQARVPKAPRTSKPLIPAVIGLITWGSSSPYALVLCVEQYLKQERSTIHWTTHVAALFSIIGTLAWTAMNVLVTPEILNLLVGNGRTMYSELAIMLWAATFVFLIWLTWRVIVFRRKEYPEAEQPQNNAINSNSPSAD